MLKASDYRLICDGAWRLVVLPEAWRGELPQSVLALAEKQVPSKHPQTLEIHWPAPETGKQYYLKVFHTVSLGGALKNLFRSSKALRFWRQGLALSAEGFNVPQTIAAGELRHSRLVQRGFVLTAKLEGQSLPVFLAHLANDREADRSLQIKRSGLLRVAQLIRQFHRLGFVHGDLVASNLFIGGPVGQELAFFFMDNDRTRRSPRWFPQSSWKRNLIQLNRMPLPGITLQDRIRFLHAYLDRSRLSRSERYFARWIENKTRKRRYECDGVDPTMSFRKLMRWSSDVAVNSDGSIGE